MTTTSEGWTATAAAVASVQDKNREIPWCWLRHRCLAWALLGEDDHFSCHFKKEATQPWKIDGPLLQYIAYGAIMYTKNAKFVPTNGSFKAHLDGKLCKEKL